MNNIIKADSIINSRLFRPPYGRMKRNQLKELTHGENNRTVVMWNILAGDWDATVTPERCFERIKNKIKEGDIIVLHESEKAWMRMQYTLPKVLEHFSQLGLQFKKIEPFPIKS
jgi:peptidoglycan/xylan/chitin deacetylase (PgdA/CDA1 family)